MVVTTCTHCFWPTKSFQLYQTIIRTMIKKDHTNR